MSISGIDGGNCVMSSIARIRFEKGVIEGADIVGNEGVYHVRFTGEGAIWKGENLVLSSARQPYEARVFKSIDGAMSAVQRVGLKTATIITETPA